MSWDRKVRKERYLGDGLYASFDGYQVRLWAPRVDGEHEVFMDPDVYRELVRFESELHPPPPVRMCENCGGPDPGNDHWDDLDGPNRAGWSCPRQRPSLSEEVAEMRERLKR